MIAIPSGCPSDVRTLIGCSDTADKSGESDSVRFGQFGRLFLSAERQKGGNAAHYPRTRAFSSTCKAKP